jgi:transcriptional regulator with XRE-family HTH domain
MALGKTILAIREAKGFTQEALAKLTGWSEDNPKQGVSQGVISALEKRDSKSSKHARVLAKALNVSVDILVSGEPSDFQTMQDVTNYDTKDPILEDLAALEPEDADVWRTQIRAAAIKARRLKEERIRDRVNHQPTDPPLKVRRA